MRIHYKKLLAFLTLGSLLAMAGPATAKEPTALKSAPPKVTSKIDRNVKKPTTVARSIPATQDVINHAPFEILLTKYVNSKGSVAYDRWHADKADREALKDYLGQIATAQVNQHSENARLAFYINAYNALVLDAILDKWPVQSVMSLDGFFDKQTHTVAGQKMTLDDLEHNKVIRVQFQEPRIHFLLVCAAQSCPRLLTTALTAINLEKNLENAAREFIPAATRVEGNKVYTSQLFNWFRQDFEKHSGSIQAYLSRYVSADVAKVLNNGTSTIEFTEYDWSINKQ